MNRTRKTGTGFCMDCKSFTPTAWYAATDSWECANCYNAPPPEPDVPDLETHWPLDHGATPSVTYMCRQCGAIVGDTVMHNDFHYKVDNTAERANMPYSGSTGTISQSFTVTVAVTQIVGSPGSKSVKCSSVNSRSVI